MACILVFLSVQCGFWSGRFHNFADAAAIFADFRGRDSMYVWDHRFTVCAVGCVGKKGSGEQAGTGRRCHSG